jgi:hypothetical protein
MNRILSLAFLVLLTATGSGQSKPDPEARHEICVATLSSFATDPSLTKPPDLPSDLDAVTIEYSSSGCYGNCPAFRLRIEKGKATWEGHAFVRKKGKAEKQISVRQFADLVEAWLAAKMYAMRDDYCLATCPDGTVIIITDVQSTAIAFKAQSYSKTVSECFTTANGKAQNPKPPEQYFDLSRQLILLARSNHWL